MRGHHDLKPIKNGVNWIENQVEIDAECSIILIGEQLDEVLVQVSLELNVVESYRVET